MKPSLKPDIKSSDLKTEYKAVDVTAHKAAMQDFSSTFAAFKDANDARIAALESKHSVDTLITDKVERLNDALDMQQKRLDRLAVSAGQVALSTADSRPSEAKAAWGQYIRTGDLSGLQALEGKLLTTGTNTEGGYMAPAETQNTIDSALAQASTFRSIATVRQVGSGLFKKPVSAGGADSGWAEEIISRLVTQAPELTLLEFPAGELYAMPAATQALLDDDYADIDQWLAEEIRDVLAAKETTAFISGDGDYKPRGILNYTQQPNDSHSWGNLGYVATGTDGDFDADAPIDAILDLIYAPDTRYRSGASFIMNRRTVGSVRKFKDADGNYIWQPANEAGAASTLLGYPLLEVEDMPDVASGSTPIAFGDFRRGYLIVDRQGIRVVRDPYSAKPFVLFYTTKRVGGGVQDFNAIKLLKFSAN